MKALILAGMSHMTDFVDDYVITKVILINSDTTTRAVLDIPYLAKDITTVDAYKTFITGEIHNYCVSQSIADPASTAWFMVTKDIPSVPAGLASAPQAAIADAPADAVTDYNVLTTLLGTLTGAVNTANSKQNDIATKLNDLLGKLRTLGLISA